MDQFYTNEDVSIKCFEILKKEVNIESYDIQLEPSAGCGSFYKLMNPQKRIGLDIQPKYEGIIQQDFLSYTPTNQSYICIGNPPFGRVSSLAIKFFNKCAQFSDVIAFIIPRTFNKVSVQNKLNLNFILQYSEDLPLNPCCFTPKMSAKCCFQIWVRSCVPRQITVYSKTHPHFDFIPYGEKDDNNQPTPPQGAHFAIRAYGGKCGQIVDQGLQNLRPKSWHFIKANINIDLLKDRFNSLDYSLSTMTVRQNSLGKFELIHLYSTFIESLTT
tara:strand:- start:2141 stop:2956 length:816 start_codon:yes stop_codon:yes gene_type:complete